MNTGIRAIILEKDSVLLIHRIKGEQEYWVFPGGGMEEIDHNSDVVVLQREFKEELGVEVEVGDLFEVVKTESSEEKFYFCTIVGGILGTGDGPEFQKDTGYKQRGLRTRVAQQAKSCREKSTSRTNRKKTRKGGFVNISINGIDGTGKSTQIKLLSEFGPDDAYTPGPLFSYSKRWPNLSGKEFSTWWFETIPMFS